jgi:hypothetical protein
MEPEADRGEHPCEGNEVLSNFGRVFARGVGSREQGLVNRGRRVVGGSVMEIVFEGSTRAIACRVKCAIDIG